MGLAVGMALVYLLLQPGTWVPSSDGDLFLSIARNLAEGQGYISNGFPVIKLPPLWPVVLSGVLTLSSRFLLLAVVQTFFLCTALFLFHRILLRYVSARAAFWGMVAVGLNFHWFRLCRIAYSDPLFLVLVSAAMLLALHEGERRPSVFRLVALLILVFLSIATRWIGLISAPMVAAALWVGNGKATRLCRSISSALILATAAGTFFSLRAVLAMVGDKYMQKIDPLFAQSFEPIDTTLSGLRGILAANQSYSFYLAQAGTWIAYLFGQPMEFLSLLPMGNALVLLAGWALLLLIVWQAGLNSDGASKVTWLAVGLLIALLAARWTRPNVRYLLPVLPFLSAAVIELTLRPVPREGPNAKRLAAQGFRLFVGLLIFGNLTLFAIDSWAARASEPLRRFAAGQYVALHDIVRHLNKKELPSHSIAISATYENLGRTRLNSSSYRALMALSRHSIRMAPASASCPDNPADLLEWAQLRDVKYFVHRPPTEPWRIYHFSAGRIQSWLTGHPPDPPPADFLLYRVRDSDLQLVSVPRQSEPVRALPGWRQ